MNDNLVSRGPVSRSSNLVGITSLKRIDNSKDFIELTTGRSRVGESQTDSLLGVDDVNGTDSEGDTVSERENECRTANQQMSSS